MAAKGHSEIVSQLVGPRDTAHPLTALALPVSSHSKLLNRPHPSPRTLRCLFAPRPTTRAPHDQPGVPLSTAHRAWGRRGPVLHPKPDEKRVPIVLRPADPCRKLQQPVVTVAQLRGEKGEWDGTAFSCSVGRACPVCVCESLEVMKQPPLRWQAGLFGLYLPLLLGA